MSDWQSFPFLLVPYSLSATVVCLPILWWFRSIGWRWWELVLPILPSLLWCALILFVSEKGKTLSNLVIEPLLSGCFAFLPLAMKVTAARRGWSVEAGYLLGVMVSFASVMSIYFFMPGIPE